MWGDKIAAGGFYDLGKFITGETHFHIQLRS